MILYGEDICEVSARRARADADRAWRSADAARASAEKARIDTKKAEAAAENAEATAAEAAKEIESAAAEAVETVGKAADTAKATAEAATAEISAAAAEAVEAAAEAKATVAEAAKNAVAEADAATDKAVEASEKAEEKAEEAEASANAAKTAAEKALMSAEASATSAEKAESAMSGAASAEDVAEIKESVAAIETASGTQSASIEALASRVAQLEESPGIETIEGMRVRRYCGGNVWVLADTVSLSSEFEEWAALPAVCGRKDFGIAFVHQKNDNNEQTGMLINTLSDSGDNAMQTYFWGNGVYYRSIENLTTEPVVSEWQDYTQYSLSISEDGDALTLLASNGKALSTVTLPAGGSADTSELEADITELQNSLSTLNATVSGHETRITTLEDTSGATVDKVSWLESSYNILGQNVNHFSENISELQSDVSSLQETVESLASDGTGGETVTIGDRETTAYAGGLLVDLGTFTAAGTAEAFAARADVCGKYTFIVFRMENTNNIKTAFILNLLYNSGKNARQEYWLGKDKYWRDVTSIQDALTADDPTATTTTEWSDLSVTAMADAEIEAATGAA